jgi:DHA1 family multidrug resistance protein-like MFS transporter
MDAPFRRRSRAARAREPLPRSVTRLVGVLALAIVLQWVGAGAILPLLPLYVKVHSGSDAIVGAVMAAYFAAAFFFQYGSGRISDRLGRLPVLVGGLLVYAAGSLLFLVPGPAALDIVFRGLQGAGAGGAIVAALAMVSHAVPVSHRGRASGRIYGAELGGLAVGPALGSVAGVGAMRMLFVAAGIASVVAAGAVLLAWRSVRAVDEGGAARDALGPERPVAAAMPAGRREQGDVAEVPSLGDRRHAAKRWSGGRRLPRTVSERAVWGAFLAAASMGVTAGVYETCWTLLMTRHGAASWEVGVSWTMFALPFVLMSRPAGWLADHLDRRWLGIAALIWAAAFCASYPFVPGVVLLMVLGIWESAGYALALPASQSLLGEGTASEHHGHAQGLFAACQTGTTAIAAAAAGGLYGIAPWVPFDVAAACCVPLVGLVAWCWRAVPGRVRTATPVHVSPADMRR